MWRKERKKDRTKESRREEKIMGKPGKRLKAKTLKEKVDIRETNNC